LAVAGLGLAQPAERLQDVAEVVQRAEAAGILAQRFAVGTLRFVQAPRLVVRQRALERGFAGVDQVRSRRSIPPM
jgi:hypothetical protein